MNKKKKKDVSGIHNTSCLQFTKDIEAEVNCPFEELSSQEQLRLVKAKLIAEDPLYALLFSHSLEKNGDQAV